LETGETFEIKLINVVINLRFKNDEEFVELRGYDDGWA
jgi:hypothetical protein